NAPTLLSTLDLHQFADQALTNSAAALLALYPDLVITSTTNTFHLGFVTNFTAVFTNSPTAPAGTPPRLIFVTNISLVAVTNFHHTFANVITNQFRTSGFFSTQTT